MEKLYTEVDDLHTDRKFRLILAGACAGIINGLFGGGGGTVLVPLLTLLTDLRDRDIFSSSVAIILPICLVTLTATILTVPVPWRSSLPYLIGSGIGGYTSVRFGHQIPVRLLHKVLGILILWGGIRYLC